MRRPQAHHCQKLGVALAEFHNAGTDFTLSRENTLGQKDWAPLWQKCASSADNVADGLAAEVTKDMGKFESDWPENLPSGIIHADLFPDNVFFLNETLSWNNRFLFRLS